MAQRTEFVNFDTLMLQDKVADYERSLDYGRSLIAERGAQGVALKTFPSAWTPFREHLPEALDYVARGAPIESIHNDQVSACIIDEDSGDRTYLDSEIAIFQICSSVSRAYGARAYMEERERILQCWETTRKNASTLVLIQATGFSSKTIQVARVWKYTVMDHFRVGLIWTEENDDGEHVHYVRLEKCNLLEKSWWTPKQRDPPARREFLDRNEPFYTEACSSCGEKSPHIYKEALLCLNRDCPHFFRSIGADLVGNLAFSDLTYNDGFLLYRTYIHSERRPAFPLVNDLILNLRSMTASALPHSQMLLRGIICTRCLAIVPKFYWNRWSCTTCAPDKAQDEPCDPGLIDLRAIVPRNFVSYDGHPPLNFEVPKPFAHELPSEYKEFYSINKWMLHNGCQLMVLSPTAAFNGNARGPNGLFTKVLQDANIGNLRLHRHKEEGTETIETHFQSHWGAQYGFIGFEDSVPLDQAPASVTAARELLENVGNVEVRSYSESNAVQVFGFMQGQEIKWHTDGEGELGDTQSMLNLGGDAILKIRLQQAYYNNENAFGEGGEVVRGAKNWEKAAKIKALAAQGIYPHKSDIFEYTHRQTHDPQPEIRIPLIHGSIVIMQGKLFSKYYENSLDTLNPLTFLIVTRSINEVLHDELLNTKYAVNSDRPNGLLFTTNFEDPGDVDEERSPSPENNNNLPIPIVVQHVRPRPTIHLPYHGPDRGAGRSPSPAPSADSTASSSQSQSQARKDRLMHLRSTTNMSYEQIRQQEGWLDWSSRAMGSAYHREKERRGHEGTNTTPSPNIVVRGYSPSLRARPQPASQASNSGDAWTQVELDELWEMRNRDPPVQYEEIERTKGGKRTAKAYREQMAMERKRRAAGQSRTSRSSARSVTISVRGRTTLSATGSTRTRRATLTATRARADERGETPQLDVPNVPALPSFEGPYRERGATGGEEEDEEEEGYEEE